MEADFDFTPVIREWVKSVPNELDFVTERDNMLRVSKVLLHTHYIDVKVLLHAHYIVYVWSWLLSVTPCCACLRCYYTHIMMYICEVGARA